MNNPNGEPIFKTGQDIYMNYPTNETVFITGTGMKNKTFLTAGSICIVLGLVLTGVFSSESYSVVFWGAILYGIFYIVYYFKYQKMTIAVTNLRITGRCVYHSSVDIPLGQVRSVEMKGTGFLWLYYTDNSGKQKKLVFPKMENTEQICNAIYSLISAPPAPRA